MSGHADTIRPTIRHDKMRVLNSWQHPSSCPGCAANVALDALLAENQRLREALETVQGDVYLWRLREIDTDKAMDAIDKSVAMLDSYREALAGDTEPPDPDTSPFETPSFETVEKGIDWIDRRVHGDDG